ncbi:MAG: glycosyltransferase family 2 protein [Helicobacteraceae bacterium]|nr:glycosyltransferase family 2 protein [Helicobacteraceae bacterium]
MSKPIVSFCIATYNRAERVYALVKSILSYELDNIEVCVNDNASTDNTKELLSNINDSRFKYYENGATVCATKNMLTAIYRASGKYAFYCNDRDLVVVEHISKLVAFLSERDLAYVYCGHVVGGIIYDSSISAYSNLFFFKHPTGEIFNVQLLAKLNLEHYLAFEKDLPYIAIPFYCIFAEIALLGPCAEIPNMFWKLADDSYIKSNPSGSAAHTEKRMWRYFLPAEFAPQVISGLNYMIDMKQFNKVEISKICCSVYKKEALRVMEFYAGVMAKPIYAYRYNYNIIVNSVFDQYRHYRLFYKIYKSSNPYAYHSFLQKFGLSLFGVYIFYRILVRPLKVYLLYKSSVKTLLWRLISIRNAVVSTRRNLAMRTRGFR